MADFEKLNILVFITYCHMYSLVFQIAVCTSVLCTFHHKCYQSSARCHFSNIVGRS